MRKFSLKFSPLGLWVIILIAPLPFVIFLFHFLFSLNHLEKLEEEIERIHLKTVHIEESKRRENSVAASLKNSDPHYLDKYIETLTFLFPEIKKLETILADNPENEQLIKRLHDLQEGSNRLRFAEEQIRTHELFREIEEKQQQPIELNEEDLKKLLCLLEGITIWPYGPKEGRPQLIIKDFHLSRKECPTQEKVFVLSLQLIKRENI